MIATDWMTYERESRHGDGAKCCCVLASPVASSLASTKDKRLSFQAFENINTSIPFFKTGSSRCIETSLTMTAVTVMVGPDRFIMD